MVNDDRNGKTNWATKLKHVLQNEMALRMYGITKVLEISCILLRYLYKD